MIDTVECVVPPDYFPVARQMREQSVKKILEIVGGSGGWAESKQFFEPLRVHDVAEKVQAATSAPARCMFSCPKSTRRIDFLQPVLFVCSGRLAVFAAFRLRLGVESGANRSVSTAWTENTRACRHTACRSHALFVHGPHRRVKVTRLVLVEEPGRKKLPGL
jgi:hypothetical protein